MSAPHYDRLSASDLVFLEMEDGPITMHIGAVCVFDGTSLLGTRGGFDMRRMRAFVAGSLAGNPRFRQRLAAVPVLEHPVWVDDPDFDLRRHVSHVRLPAPGGPRQLKRLAGALMETRLPRDRPLWEMCFVDGLTGGRAALIARFHHCMIDGISGVDILGAVLRLAPERRLPAAMPWRPRPLPSGARLLADELARRASAPLEALRGVGALWRDPRHALATAATALHDLGAVGGATLGLASPTPLNVAVGPRRHVDWTAIDLAAVKAIKARWGGTVNDVVLTVLAGAVGRWLRDAGVDVGGLDFRLTMPASIRAADEHGTLGNKVGVLTLSLPIAERDPRRRLRAIVKATDALKHSGQLHGVALIAEASDRVFPPLAGWLAWGAARARTYNLSVTNVPGPPVPVYLLGARLQAIYPLAFLFARQALTVAILSYDGRLFWSLTADPDALPDLRPLFAATRDELARLRAVTARRAARR
ncbi:MAG: wax ester/triacylglycerol synthase family O-acyltransferase [Candidatus Binatia bacterium]